MTLYDTPFVSPQISVAV